MKQTPHYDYLYVQGEDKTYSMENNSEDISTSHIGDTEA
jgi:hypothetical protein